MDFISLLEKGHGKPMFYSITQLKFIRFLLVSQTLPLNPSAIYKIAIN